MTQPMTPLFQTNLLLHMCIPYHENTGFNPYFYNNGYKIKHIEKDIPLTYEGIRALEKLNINRKNVKPEVVLTKENTVILIECKVSDFKLDCTHRATQQAAGYFTLTPEYLQQYFGMSPQKSGYGKILYGVPDDSVHVTSQTLTEIKDTLELIINTVLPHDIFSILINEEGTFIGFEENGHTNLVKIIDARIMQNNSMIYILPVEPNGQKDAMAEEILRSQVKMKMRSIIGRSLSIQGFTFETAAICKSVNPLWEALPKKFQRKLLLWVNNAILNLVRDLEKSGIKIQCDKKVYTCSKLSKKQLGIIENYLISDSLLDEAIEDFTSVQLSLDI